MIMNAGIEEVRYVGGYPDPLAMELAADGGLNVVQLRHEARRVEP